MMTGLTTSAIPEMRTEARTAPAGRAERFLLLELNELCPTLLQQFMAEGHIPNFKRFYEQSLVYTTDAGEPASHLEPWIQWPTVHSGQPFAEHRAYQLGDGRRIQAKCLAQVLSDAGIPVGVCGSMNTNYQQLNGYLLPDPWDQNGSAWPAPLDAYAGPVGRLVRESSRDSASKKDLFRLGWFLLRNGLSLSAIRDAIGQLVAEKRDRGVKWRRACVLDRLQYDIFRSLNARHNVRFATFFCNSTAHFQHYYWRHMDPQRFDMLPDAADHPSLSGAILTGYRRMDRLVGLLMRDYPDARLAICTALSQQPWTDTTKCTYRPKKFADLLAFAGVALDESAVKPVMAEQFHLQCGSAEQADAAETLLRDLTLDGSPAMSVKRKGDNIFAGCRVTSSNVLDFPITRQATGTIRPFRDLFYRIHTMRSGKHHPEGVLWVRTGQHRVVEERVPLTSIAPTVLQHFGVAPPETMRDQALELD